jgi:solute carrier family 5 (sodium-coupled monocarboxylate transporter), member 8/12
MFALLNGLNIHLKCKKDVFQFNILQGAFVGSATALSFMTWICFKAQRAIATGEIKFPTKAVSTSGCNYHFIAEDAMSMLAINETTTSTPLKESPGFHIYQISYLWYTLVGSSICIIVSLIASYIIGPNKPCEINPNLLAPFVRKLIKPRASEAASNKAENVMEISFQLKRKVDDDDDESC